MYFSLKPGNLISDYSFRMNISLLIYPFICEQRSVLWNLSTLYDTILYTFDRFSCIQ